MEALFLRVLTLSAVCSLVLLPLLLCARRLTNRYAARTLYFLWLLLALRLVLPFQIDLARPAVTMEVPRYEVSLPAGGAGQGMGGEQDLPTGAVSVPDGGGETAARAAPGIPLLELLALIWLAVAAALLCVQTVSYLAARRRLIKAAVLMPAMAPGLKRPVPLYRCALVQTPMTLGLLRPVILLPEGERDAETLELVLRHEACHIKRRDVCYKALLLLAADLHWFDPLVWWMGRAAGRNLELCCDDAVLSGAGSEKRRKYGEILLKNASEERYPTLCTHFGGGKRQMKDRLANLFQKKRKSAALVASVLAVALLLSGLVACERAPEAGMIPAEALDAVEASVAFDWDMENVTFTLPPEYSPDSDWDLHVAGRMRMGNDGTGMSLHYFEGEKWKSGNTYLINLTEAQRADITELELNVSLPDPTAEGGVLERIIDLRAWLPEGEEGETPQPTPTPEIEAPEPPSGKIRNLPEELYEVCPVHADKNVGRSSRELSYDFQVQEPMDFTLAVEQVSGTIDIGVKDKDTGEYAVAPKGFGTETTSFHLEQGRYRLVLNMDTFQGTYHVVGTPAGAAATADGEVYSGRLVSFSGGAEDTVLIWQETSGTMTGSPVESWDIPVELLDGTGNTLSGTFGDLRGELDVRTHSAFTLTLKDGMVVGLVEVDAGEQTPAGRVWPLDGYYHVVSLFGYRIHPLTGEPRGHLGIDIEAPTGTPVSAAAGGTVAEVGRDASLGDYVIVAHSDFWRTKYAGLKDITVQEGEKVDRGTVLGSLAGEPEGEVLHYEWQGDGGTTHYDPLSKELFDGAYVKPDGTLLTAMDMEVPGW